MLTTTTGLGLGKLIIPAKVQGLGLRVSGTTSGFGLESC